MLGAFAFCERRGPVWGDGFVDDEILSIASGAARDMIAPDELFRFIPNLTQESTGCRWPESIECAFRTFLETSTRSDVDACNEFKSPELACAVVKQLVNRNEDGSSTAFDENIALSLAFFTGVHPAYIWPVALVAHDRFATFTWLGHVVRRGRALMPLEVALYLLDVLALSGYGIICSDPQLVLCVPSPSRQRGLIQAARRRVHGRSVVFDDRAEVGFFSRWLRTQ